MHTATIFGRVAYSNNTVLCSCAVKKQTGVTLRYMLDFGANPVEKQLRLSAQFLHNELPVRLAHRVAELENLPYGLSAKPHVLKVSHIGCFINLITSARSSQSR